MSSTIEAPKNTRVLDTEMSLKERIIRGFSWLFAGQVMTQGIRFATNLILTRLLLKSDFGLMALVNAVIISVTLFSDVGIRDVAIQNKRGDEADFLNTLRTIQIIRGIIIWAVIAISSPFLAMFYDEPAIIGLLLLVGLGPLIRNCSSTSILTAQRKMIPRWIEVAEITGLIVASLVMIALAYFTRSVWSLAIGTVLNGVVYMVISYNYKHGITNQLKWDKEAVRAVSHYGRWIIPSSILTIFMLQGDRLILGAIMSKDTLGLYSIGVTLGSLTLPIFHQLMLRILQPVYAATIGQSPAVFRRKVRRLRLGLLAALLLPAWVLMIGSKWIVGLLYPEAYLNAAFFCSVAALGMSLKLATDMGPVYTGLGIPKIHFRLTVVQVVSLATAIAIGYAITGDHIGIVMGIATSCLLGYPINAYLYNKVGFWFPEIDFTVIAASFSLFATFYYMIWT